MRPDFRQLDPHPAVTDVTARIPLLFLISDTGGGHRAAARAVSDALEEAHPGRFEPVLVDPLGGEDSSKLLSFVTGLYGPSIRLAPWTWGAVYYAADSKLMMKILRNTILKFAERPVIEAVDELDPAAIVSFHPLVGKAAVAGGKRARVGTPVITVVTDLITPHTAWRFDRVDALVVPSAAVRWRCHLDGIGSDRCLELGLPVGAPFTSGPARGGAERAALRRRLGLPVDRFTVLLTGGGEGSGGIARRAAAIVKHCDDVHVVALCGRNRRLHDGLERVARRSGGRLHVEGFVDNMAEWLRAVDVVVTKAGPGTIAEATACGAPLLLTSHVPGQEKGNTEFVVGSGAGAHVPGVDDLVAEVDRLRRDPDAVDGMRAAAVRLSRPHAASDIARLIAERIGLAADEPGPLSRVAEG
ncbi:MAG: glycosyltransferase [Acidimicrobiales bacterium]